MVVRRLRRMAELKRCPECGGVATVIHMYDTYDRADLGGVPVAGDIELMTGYTQSR